MPTRIKNPTAISLPITVECNGVSSSITVLSRQTITLKPGYVLSAKSRGQFPQLKVIEDVPESVPASTPPVEAAPVVEAEKKPSTTLATKVVDKNSEKGGDR